MTDILYYNFDNTSKEIHLKGNSNELKLECIENIFNMCGNNITFLKNIIEKYNFKRDKVTNIYSYYDFKSNDINCEIVILGDYYICNFSIDLDEKEKLNMYELCINYNENIIFNKYINLNSESIQIFKSNEIFQFITRDLNKLSQFKLNLTEFQKINNFVDIMNFDSNKYKDIDYETNYTNYFRFIGGGNKLLIKNNKIYYETPEINKYYSNYDLDNNTYTGYYIEYTNKDNIIKNIYHNGTLVFESDIEVIGFSHKINKLNNILNIDVCQKDKEVPYFLFDKDYENYNYLNLVYAFSPINTNKFDLNLYRIPCIMTYYTDECGELLLNLITELVLENEKKTEKKTTIFKLHDDIEEDDLNMNEYIFINCDTINILKNIFNKEYEFTVNDDLYKFIINCGLTSSKPVNNVNIVVENGANISDISRITLKNDGTAEIIRTNNSNKLSIKSVTRDKFKGNVGYKFAVCDGIPCVVSLSIPDDAEVVFDHYHNKFRTNKCTPISIKPIKDKNVVEIKNTCSICMTDEPNVMYNPCMHTSCMTCAALHDKEICHICSKKIKSFITLNVFDKKINLETATSAIYTSDFEYELNQEIIINDFDPTTYWKCSSGIHFHSSINDVYAWLEFIDIPEQLKVNADKIDEIDEIDEINMDEINFDNIQTELNETELNETKLNETSGDRIPKKKNKSTEVEV